jgi:hypothetical protein
MRTPPPQSPRANRLIEHPVPGRISSLVRASSGECVWNVGEWRDVRELGNIGVGARRLADSIPKHFHTALILVGLDCPQVPKPSALIERINIALLPLHQIQNFPAPRWIRPPDYGKNYRRRRVAPEGSSALVKNIKFLAAKPAAKVSPRPRSYANHHGAGLQRIEMLRLVHQREIVAIPKAQTRVSGSKGGCPFHLFAEILEKNLQILSPYLRGRS